MCVSGSFTFIIGLIVQHMAMYWCIICCVWLGIIIHHDEILATYSGISNHKRCQNFSNMAFGVEVCFDEHQVCFPVNVVRVNVHVDHDALSSSLSDSLHIIVLAQKVITRHSNGYVHKYSRLQYLQFFMPCPPPPIFTSLVRSRMTKTKSLCLPRISKGVEIFWYQWLHGSAKSVKNMQNKTKWPRNLFFLSSAVLNYLLVDLSWYLHVELTIIMFPCIGYTWVLN